MEQRPEPPKEAEPIANLSIKAINTDNTEVEDELVSEKPNGAISLAVDGDTDTYWHSRWYGGNNLKLPATIVIDMNQEYNLEKFDYVPRDGGSQNGRIKEATLYYSSDAIENKGDLDSINKSNWTMIEKVSWANDGSVKTITMPENIKARYLKLVVDHTYGDPEDKFIAAKEFMPFGYSHNITINNINATNNDGSAVIDQSKTPIDNIIDGDITSVWHTAWAEANKVKFPATIIMDTGKVYNLDKFDYIPRLPSEGPNGVIAKSSFCYSIDGTAWSAPVSVEWSKDNDTKTYTFPEKTFARYVKLTVEHTYGAVEADIDRYITGREFILYEGTEVLEPENPETELKDTINKSKDVLDKNAKIDELIKSTKDLSDAIVKYSQGK